MTRPESLVLIVREVLHKLHGIRSTVLVLGHLLWWEGNLGSPVTLTLRVEGYTIPRIPSVGQYFNLILLGTVTRLKLKAPPHLIGVETFDELRIKVPRSSVLTERAELQKPILDLLEYLRRFLG